jgi:hypothetical protein
MGFRETVTASAPPTARGHPESVASASGRIERGAAAIGAAQVVADWCGIPTQRPHPLRSPHAAPLAPSAVAGKVAAAGSGWARCAVDLAVVCHLIAVRAATATSPQGSAAVHEVREMSPSSFLGGLVGRTSDFLVVPGALQPHLPGWDLGTLLGAKEACPDRAAAAGATPAATQRLRGRWRWHPPVAGAGAGGRRPIAPRPTPAPHPFPPPGAGARGVGRCKGGYPWSALQPQPERRVWPGSGPAWPGSW